MKRFFLLFILFVKKGSDLTFIMSELSVLNKHFITRINILLAFTEIDREGRRQTKNTTITRVDLNI